MEITRKPRITIIAAVAENGAIGYENELIYSLPNDMKHFKSLTTGHTVIMGLRTFESLPHGALPNRRNIVLSWFEGDKERADGYEVYGSFEEALSHCDEDEDVFIIGGASVYKQALPFADRLCLTCVKDSPTKADTFFPDFSPHDWIEVSREEHKADEKHAFDYYFLELERSKPTSTPS